MADANEAIEIAALMLNDFGLVNWTKERLFKHLLLAHKQLQVKLLLSGVPVIKKKSSIIAVLADATELGTSQPTDLIEPISLWERATGTTDTFIEMKEKGWEPESQKSSELLYWVWRGEKLLFRGATTNRDVKIYYKASITVPDQEGSPLGFLYAENYIGPETAALAALSLGNKVAYDVLHGKALENYDEVVRMNISGQQSLPARRRAYRHARRIYRG